MPREDQAENIRVPRMALDDIRLLVMGGQSHVEAEGASNVYYTCWKELASEQRRK